MLEQTTREQICDDIGGTFLHRGKYDRKRVAHVRIGAMSASNVFRGARERTLLVVPGDRKNVIVSALKRSVDKAFPFCGIVLSDDIQPKGLVEKINASPLPVVSSPLDSYSIASRILSMNVKTLPGDTEKIERIQKLVSDYVNVPRILQRIGIAPSNPA